LISRHFGFLQKKRKIKPFYIPEFFDYPVKPLSFDNGLTGFW